MEQLKTLPPPPGVINSLKAGFDAIAANILMILPPLVLDIFLWLGPRFRIDQLFRPVVAEMSRYAALSGLPSTDIKLIQDFYAEFLTQLQGFNLLGMVRTFPVGVFSLMSGKFAGQSPLGIPSIIQMESFFDMVGTMGLLVFAGWISGAVFFRWVSAVAVEPETAMDFRFGQSILQTVLLSFLWVAVAVALGTPGLILLAVILRLSPLLAQGFLLVFGLFSIWLIVPAFFTPHGIFLRQQNAFASIFASFRLSRFTMPTSSLFVLSVILIGYGLNFLWNIPATDSWMALIGLAGHAFITTSLLAASFIYYRDMHVWLQTVFEKIKSTMPTQQA